MRTTKRRFGRHMCCAALSFPHNSSSSSPSTAFSLISISSRIRTPHTLAHFSPRTLAHADRHQRHTTSVGIGQSRHTRDIHSLTDRQSQSVACLTHTDSLSFYYALATLSHAPLLINPPLSPARIKASRSPSLSSAQEGKRKKHFSLLHSECEDRVDSDPAVLVLARSGGVRFALAFK